ncbi:hypothetical protein HDU82_008189 [Entophlyctis luteolus]|nr:hypothetical protein HDU82_008189 [Entophlyctis luteolus]
MLLHRLVRTKRMQLASAGVALTHTWATHPGLAGRSHDFIRRAVAKNFGYSELTSVQKRLLDALHENATENLRRDILVRSKTGTGKTLAFLTAAFKTVTPAATAGVSVLIFSPTRELAVQTAAEARKLLSISDSKHINPKSNQVTVVVGGEPKSRQVQGILNSYQTRHGSMQSANGIEVVVATPGRLLDIVENMENVRKRLANVQVVILDEADQLLDMGFQKTIQQILQHTPRPDRRHTFMFSATLSSPAVRQMAQEQLVNRPILTIDATNADEATDSLTGNSKHSANENLHSHVKQSYAVVEYKDWTYALYKTILDHVEKHYKNPHQTAEHPRIVVFFAVSKNAKYFSQAFLSLPEFASRSATSSDHRNPPITLYELHARLDQSRRAKVSDDFRRNKRVPTVLFTTDVSARGVDYPDVSLVVQVGAAASHEQYVHRVGRTGRAGKPGEGVLILGPREESFVKGLGGGVVHENNELKEWIQDEDPANTRMKDRVGKAFAATRDKNPELAESLYTAHLGFYKQQLQKSQLAEDAADFMKSLVQWEGNLKLSEKMIAKIGVAGYPGFSDKWQRTSRSTELREYPYKSKSFGGVGDKLNKTERAPAQKYTETRRIEEQLLQESTQSLLAQEPQVARKNVLGVLARRVKAAQERARRRCSRQRVANLVSVPSYPPPSRGDSDSEYVRRESSIANLRDGGNWSSDDEEDDEDDFAAVPEESSSHAIDGRSQDAEAQLQQPSPSIVVVPSSSTSKSALTKPFSSKRSRVPGLPLPQKDTRNGLANLDSSATRNKPSSSNSRAPMVAKDGDEFIIRDEYTDIDSGEEESPQLLSPEIPRSNQALSLSSSVTLKPRSACERILFLDGPAWTISSLQECYLFLLTDVLGILPWTPTAVATFLLTTPGLSKAAMGKFLAVQSHTQILSSYMRFFDFQGKDLITSFRMLLCSLRLPLGELEKVGEITEAFVERWLICNPKSLAKILPPANAMTSKSMKTLTPFEYLPLGKHLQHEAVRQAVFGLLALDYEIHCAPVRKGTNTAANRSKDLADISNNFIRSMLLDLQSSLKMRVDFSTISATACEKTHRDALIAIFNDILEESLDVGFVSSWSSKNSRYSPFAPPFCFFTMQKTASAGGTAYSHSGTLAAASSNTPAGGTGEATYGAFTTTTPFLNLTVGEASPRITLSLSQPVPGLVLEASGVNVSAEPRVLDFSSGAVSASFTVTGATVGRKVLLFTRLRSDVAVTDAVRGDSSRTDRSFADVPVADGNGSDSSAAALRRLELPAGIGVLVEPTWLKYRFAVEEFADSMAHRDGRDTTGDDNAVANSAKGELINTQVLAVSTELRFNEWEHMFKKVLLNGRCSVGGSGGYSRSSADNNDEPVSKNVMILKGNNPCGTQKATDANNGSGSSKTSSSNLAFAAQRAAPESAEMTMTLKQSLLDREHPLSRSELLMLLGAE